MRPFHFTSALIPYSLAHNFKPIHHLERASTQLPSIEGLLGRFVGSAMTSESVQASNYRKGLFDKALIGPLVIGRVSRSTSMT
jgi:hypothetical protein